MELLTSAPGGFLYVERGRERDVTISLRAQDVSRQAQTWGTHIPVVPESAAFTGEQVLSLVDVPVGVEFRSLLRVYDFDPGEPRRVHLRFYELRSSNTSSNGAAADVLLGELLLTVRTDPGLDPLHGPGYGELLLTGLPNLVGRDRIRVEVEAEQPTVRFWGFVSATNNATQHVTVISPE